MLLVYQGVRQCSYRKNQILYQSYKKKVTPAIQFIFNLYENWQKELDLSGWFYTGKLFNGAKEDGTVDFVYPEYDFWIDWGDGSAIEHYDKSSKIKTINVRKLSWQDWNEGDAVPDTWGSDDFVGSVHHDVSCINVSHVYKELGVQRVTIYGKCDNLFGHWAKSVGGDGDSKPQQTRAMRKTLYGVLIPKNRKSPLKYAYGSFFGFSIMTYLGIGVFDNLTECRTVRHLFDGANLNYIYPNIFATCKALEDVTYVFEACPISFIYHNIFRWTPNIKNMAHAFHRCIVFKEIPEGFLDYTPLCEKFDYAFRSCLSLKKIPTTLFDKISYIKNANYCFAGGQIGGTDTSYSHKMLVEHIPPVWDIERFKTTSFSNFAHGCVHADNYDDYILWATMNNYDSEYCSKCR